MENKEKALVNGIEVETDGDWYQCPECKVKSCIVDRFNYCPMCAVQLVSFEEIK